MCTKELSKKAKRQGPEREGEGWREPRVLIGPWAPGHAATTSKVRYTSIAAGKGWPACRVAAGQREDRRIQKERPQEENRIQKKEKILCFFLKMLFPSVAPQNKKSFKCSRFQVVSESQVSWSILYNFESLHLLASCRGLIENVPKHLKSIESSTSALYSHLSIGNVNSTSQSPWRGTSAWIGWLLFVWNLKIDIFHSSRGRY